MALEKTHIQPIFLRENNPKLSWYDDPYADETTVTLRVIDDPVKLDNRPYMIFNAEFGVPKPFKNGSRNPDEWGRPLYIGMTPFQLKARGAPFSEEDMEHFRNGDPLLWRQALDVKLKRGRRPFRICQMVQTALVCRAHRAGRILAAARAEIKATTGKDPIDVSGDRKTRTSTFFENEFLAKFVPISISHFNRIRTDGLLDFYGRDAISFNQDIQTEIRNHEFFYGKLQFDELLEYEKSMISVLAKAYRLINDVGTAYLNSRKSQVKTGKPDQEALDILFSRSGKASLTIEECFFLALFSGLNPTELIGGYAGLAPYFDAAVWLGQLGRSTHLEILPEVSEALIAILERNIPKHLAAYSSAEGPEDHERTAGLYVELDDIFSHLGEYAELFTGRDRLLASAKRARDSVQPVTVWGKTLLITTPVEGGPRAGDLVKLSESGFEKEKENRAEHENPLPRSGRTNSDIFLRPFILSCW